MRNLLLAFGLVVMSLAGACSKSTGNATCDAWVRCCEASGISEGSCAVSYETITPEVEASCRRLTDHMREMTAARPGGVPAACN